MGPDVCRCHQLDPFGLREKIGKAKLDLHQHGLGMPTLNNTLLPILQSINEEGGNFVGFLISRPILDAIDAGAAIDPDLAKIRTKVLEAIGGYRGKRDHRGFSQIFEAYSEGVVYLAAQARGVAFTAVDDGAKHGKTPDFRTHETPAVGFEVKTIDVFDPLRTYDGVMDRGFEMSYAATEASQKDAAENPGRAGVGFASTTFAPHGDQVVDPHGAVIQTIRKIRGNVKAGQYAAHPTFLVVSLARLTVGTDAKNLRRAYQDLRFGVDATGHAYAIAANRIGEPFLSWSHRSPGITDLGDLAENGILIDDSFIAGMIFVQTEWRHLSKPDAASTAFSFQGVWNVAWERDSKFSDPEKQAAKRVFAQLCEHWNDTEASRDALIPN